MFLTRGKACILFQGARRTLPAQNTWLQSSQAVKGSELSIFFAIHAANIFTSNI
jgi:hypothetical protein